MAILLRSSYFAKATSRNLSFEVPMYFSNRFILLTLASSLGLDAKDNAAKPKDSLNVAAHENNAGVSSSAEPIKHFQGFEKNDLLCDRQHNTSVLVTKKDIVRRIRGQYQVLHNQALLTVEDVVARGVVSKSGTDAKHKYQSNAESACSSLRSKSPIPLYNVGSTASVLLSTDSLDHSWPRATILGRMGLGSEEFSRYDLYGCSNRYCIILTWCWRYLAMSCH